MKLRPATILACGWAVYLFYAYPGFVDVVAGDLFLDARSGQFGDWSSPIMARVLWLVAFVMGGPPGALLLQSSLFLGGAYILLRRICPDQTAALVAAGLLVMPPVIATHAVISTTSMFTAFALGGTALATSTRPRCKIGGLALLLLASDMHAAAPFAVVPLVVFGFVWSSDLPRARRYAISIGAAVTVLAGSVAFEHAIVEARSYRKEVLLARYDIRGIARQGATADDPQVVGLLALDADRDQTAIIAGRRTLIAAHPGAYARHRLRHLRNLLLARPHVQQSFVVFPDHADLLSHRGRHSPIQRALNASVRVVARTPLGRPVLYFALAVAVLVVALVRRQRLAAFLVTSGLAYELGAGALTTTSDAPQSHWLVVMAVLGVAVLAVTRRAPRAGVPPR